MGSPTAPLDMTLSDYVKKGQCMSTQILNAYIIKQLI